MDARSAADIYKQSSIENAPPVKVVRLLYDGAIRFIDRALLADPADPQSNFIENVARADAIVTELRCSLDKDPSEELATNLESLYLFVEGRLGEASLGRIHTPLESARSVLETLLEAWAKVELDAQGA